MALPVARESVLLHDLVLASERRTPDAVAVVIGEEQVTYSQLLDRARFVAAVLVEYGAGPEVCVGVAVDRSMDALVALLGTLLSGSAYVPFAWDMPAERIRQISAEAAIEVIVGSHGVLEQLPPTAVPLLAVAGGLRREPVSTRVEVDNAAYVVFTSGTAGRPKGVITPHRQVVSSTLARFEVFSCEPDMNYLMLAPFTFDAATAGIYFTLAAGGRLIVPTDDQIVDAGLLANIVEEYSVTHVDGVPSQYTVLATFQPKALAGLKCAILAGEALPISLARLHFAAAPNVPLFNEYGPTEGTVWSTVHRCSPEDDGPLMPIGLAIPGVRIAVLDEELDSVDSGATGELCVSGAGVARGYLNQPRLTAEQFVPDPYSSTPGARMYRTGDLGYVNGKGEFVFLGRMDNQVKVRGFRVETSEVEGRILAHPAIAAVAVVPRPTPSGTRLAACIVVRDGTAPSSANLQAFVADRLPNYMVPTVWLALPRLPLNSNGKLDRGELEEFFCSPARTDNRDDVPNPETARRPAS